MKTTWITICETCKRTGWDAEAGEPTHGEVLAAMVEKAADKLPNVKTRRQACLMGCDGACNVTIQGPDKIGYTLGDFTPDVEAAEGIAEYAGLHAESETGQVPYRTWPQAIKGHFVTRHLPLPSDE